MSYNGILFAYAFVISASSIFFGKTLNPYILLVFAILYVVASFMENRLRMPFTTLIILLITFHWLTQMAWCLPLYLSLIHI